MKRRGGPWFQGDKMLAEHPVRVSGGIAAVWFVLGLAVSGGDVLAAVESGGGFGLFILFMCWMTKRRVQSSGDHRR